MTILKNLNDQNFSPHYKTVDITDYFLRYNEYYEMDIGEICVIEKEDSTINIDLLVNEDHMYVIDIVSDFPGYSQGMSDTLIVLYPNFNQNQTGFSNSIINYINYTSYNETTRGFIIGTHDSFISSIISIKAKSHLTRFSGFGHNKPATIGFSSGSQDSSLKWEFFGSIVFYASNYKKIVINRIQ